MKSTYLYNILNLPILNTINKGEIEAAIKTFIIIRTTSPYPQTIFRKTHENTHKKTKQIKLKIVQEQNKAHDSRLKRERESVPNC